MNSLSDLPKEFLKEGQCIQKPALGDSMIPTITDGALLLIEPLGMNSLKLGEVVYFIDNKGNTKIHRVFRVMGSNDNERIQTWGDNCSSPDDIIYRHQILGRVVACQKGGGWCRFGSPIMVYFKLFIKRYVWFYIRRLPHFILAVFNRTNN